MLPDNYKKPAPKGNYFKPVKGANQVRILSEAMIGWIDWDKTGEKPKPVRTPEEKPQLGNQYPKHFWTFVVWDYAASAIKIWEITQATIQDALFDLDGNPNWGDPTKYDLVVTRKGDGLDTEYTTMPNPASPLAPEISAAIAKTKIDLKKLWTNEDPFLDGPVSTPDQQAVPPAPAPATESAPAPAPTGTALPPAEEPPAPEDDDIKIENIPY